MDQYMNNDRTTLVKRNGKDVSVGYGKYCFLITKDGLVKDNCQLAGAQYNGKLDELEEAFAKASYAFLTYNFDKVEEN